MVVKQQDGATHAATVGTGPYSPVFWLMTELVLPSSEMAPIKQFSVRRGIFSVYSADTCNHVLTGDVLEMTSVFEPWTTG
jgi:hypothetical protein